MRNLALLLLLTACDAAGRPILGGQEGEPVAEPPVDAGFEATPDAPPAPAPPAAPGDPDADGGCEVVAHCMGDGWCASYSADTVPDLETTCPDHWAEGPCPSDAWSTCPLGADLCTVIWLYADDDSICSP